MTGLPGNIDQQSSRKSDINFQYNLLLSAKRTPLYLSAGIGYSMVRYTADGYFTINAGKYVFAATPDNFKQHDLDMQYLHVPVLLKIVPFKETATGIGLYADYLLKATSRYKISQNKITIDAPVQNKFTAGLAFDEEIVLLSDKNKKTGCIVGFGASYQLTKNLKDSESFKPFGAYIKIGIGIW
jgi:opacity protein-like surface antigen